MRKETGLRTRSCSWFLAVLCLGLCFIFWAQFAPPVQAKSFHFPKVLIEAELHPDGSMSVVEERTFNFDGRFRGAFQHIYLKHNASIRDVQVSEQGEPYEQMPIGTQDIPGIFYVEEKPGLIYIDWSFEALNEERTFTVSYIVDDAVLVHDDVAELYYQFIGDESDERTDFARVVLTLPGSVPEDELRVWGHGPLYGNVSKEDNRVVWEITDLPKLTFLEGRVVFPAQLVPGAAHHSGQEGLPVILKEEEKWAAKANRARLFSRVDLYGGVVVFLGALILYLFLRFRAHRDPQAYPGDYFRDLPGEYSPAEAGYFSRLGRTVPEDITATIMDLTRRGHLQLEEYTDKKGLVIKRAFTDYRIYRGKGTGQLAPHENHLLNFIFKQVARSGESATFRDIETYAKRNRNSTASFFEDWKTRVENRVKKMEFFGGPVWAGIITGIVLCAAGLLSIWAELLITTGIVTFLCGLLLLILSLNLKNLTPKGADHYAKWKAFKRFLLHFSQLESSTIPSLEIWEHYLVYAVALGVAKQVIKQLQVVYPQIREQTHMTIAPCLYMAMNNPASFDRIGTSMQQSFRTARSSSSSGSGGGGGFSGGGGGGGGGGGVGAR